MSDATLPFGRSTFSRRAILAAAVPAALALGRPALAEPREIGEAFDVRGSVVSRQADRTRALRTGSNLLLKDTVETGEASFARLELAGRTTVRLGSAARLLLDEYVAEMGGVLELGSGAMLFDRAEDLPKIDLKIRSGFGLIGVRGTQFFAGPSRGVFGVFVARGSVMVEAAGVLRQLGEGYGVDIASPGARPTVVKRWGDARIAEAFAAVGL